MNTAAKISLVVGGVTATVAVTAIYMLTQRKRQTYTLSNEQWVNELAQPSDEQEDKMLYEGSQTAIQYINQWQNEKDSEQKH